MVTPLFTMGKTRRFGAFLRVFLLVSAHCLVAGAKVGAAADLTAPPLLQSLQPDFAARADLSVEERQRVANVAALAPDFARAEPYEAMAAGAATFTGPVNRLVFQHGFANLDEKIAHDFVLGEALFQKLWVPAPSSTQASDGLGPLFNARSCESCHQRAGRGHGPVVSAAPDAAGVFEVEDATSLFLRLARPARSDTEKAEIANLQRLNFPDKTYGRQLQDRAVPGLPAEGKLTLRYETSTKTLAGGEVITLQKPIYGIKDLAYGPVETDTVLSPRLANSMLGMGLIEAIAESDITSLAKRQVESQTGVKGVPSFVKDHLTGKVVLGRFGWKAENGTVRDQSASALVGDIGISSPDDPRHAGDCTEAETRCMAMPNGVQKRLGPVEAPPPVLDLITFYAEHLAPPKRRDVNNADVLRGKALFYQSGCALCHYPKFVTRADVKDTSTAFQLIWPYSDFLLHDMGDDLADGQQVGLATGRQWRTPPLWGLGNTKLVTGTTFYLHDGRARSLPEAILWHGGEADNARNAFQSMAPDDRKALIRFLESL